MPMDLGCVLLQLLSVRLHTIIFGVFANELPRLLFAILWHFGQCSADMAHDDRNTMWTSLPPNLIVVLRLLAVVTMQECFRYVSWRCQQRIVHGPLFALLRRRRRRQVRCGMRIVGALAIGVVSGSMANVNAQLIGDATLNDCEPLVFCALTYYNAFVITFGTMLLNIYWSLVYYDAMRRQLWNRASLVHAAQVIIATACILHDADTYAQTALPGSSAIVAAIGSLALHAMWNVGLLEAFAEHWMLN